MEKLTSDLAALFLHDYSPNGTQISSTASFAPVIPGFTYTDPDGSSGYKVQFTAKSGAATCTPSTSLANCVVVATPTTAIPVPDDPTTGTTIAAGPYQGFKGLVTHYNIMVTARSNSGGSEIRMRRELQTVAVPVFQFGLFSESSLSFHSGNDFNFGGRIHTNGDLFLTAGNGATLTLSDKVTAVGEIVRKYLDSGILATGNWNGNVSMAKNSSQFVDLGADQGSVTDGLPAWPAPIPANSACTHPSCLNDPVWTNLSIGTYNGYIRNGRTGAKRLDLPLVSYGALPIDLIRRPVPPTPCPVTVLAEDDCKLDVYQQRYYSQASLRILLSDTAADISRICRRSRVLRSRLRRARRLFGPSRQTGPDRGVGSPGATTIGPIRTRRSSADTSRLTSRRPTAPGSTPRRRFSTLASRDATCRTARRTSCSTAANAQWYRPRRTAVANLCLGSAETDTPTRSYDSSASKTRRRQECRRTSISARVSSHRRVPTPTPADYWPLALYDTREGVKRDESGAIATDTIVIGGVMYYVELDTTNLAKWFRGAAGFADGFGTLAKNDNNGYIVYFSDRRNNRNAANKETGEFGNEDIINPATAAGTANNVLDPGEDVNAYVPVAPATYTPVLDTYGTRPNHGHSGDGRPRTCRPAPVPVHSPLGPTATVNDVLATGGSDPAVSTNASMLRGNRPIFFRRALKLTQWRYPAHGRHQRPDHRVREPGLRRGQLQRLGPGGLRDRGAHRAPASSPTRSSCCRTAGTTSIRSTPRPRRAWQRGHEFGGGHQLSLRGRRGQVDLVSAVAGHRRQPRLDAGNRLRERRRRP